MLSPSSIELLSLFIIELLSLSIVDLFSLSYVDLLILSYLMLKHSPQESYEFYHKVDVLLLLSLSKTIMPDKITCDF